MLAPLVLAMVVTGSIGEATAGGQAGATRPPPAAAAQAAEQQPWPPAGVFKPGGDVKPPRVISDVKPNYTAAAMTAKVQGRVYLEAVIAADGKVGEVRVTKSLDREHGLDEEAIAAMKKWRFDPGTKDGAAVPVLVVVEMSFALRK